VIITLVVSVLTFVFTRNLATGKNKNGTIFLHYNAVFMRLSAKKTLCINGSFAHQVIAFESVDFFYIPTSIKTLVRKYFRKFLICYITQGLSTGWHQLRKGIAMGCSISPILFTAAF